MSAGGRGRRRALPRHCPAAWHELPAAPTGKMEADATHSPEACTVEGGPPSGRPRASALKLLQKLGGGGLAQERKRNFADGEVQTACVRVREIHIKTQYHLTPTRLAKTKSQAALARMPGAGGLAEAEGVAGAGSTLGSHRQ